MARVQGDDDTGAFEELYDRHVARALRIVRTVAPQASRAEDAVQEGFLSVWRSRASYRPEAGSFQGWAMTVIRHRVVDSIGQDTAGDRPRPAEVENVVPDGAPDSLPEKVVACTENEALRASMQLLPAAQAEVIALAFFGELTHTEIAAQLSLPEDTVKGRMRLGLHKLASQMEPAS